jgi:MFS family permease
MNPFQEAPNSKKMLTIAGLYIAVVSQIFISTSYSGMLPLAALDFADGTMWPLAIAVSGILGFAIMPLFGYFGAKHPHIKRILAAVSLFIGAVVLLSRGIAPNMTLIVVTSLFWGFVSASIYVLGFTMVRDMFDQQKSGTYLGVFGSMISLGMLIGPFLSGIVMDNFGWRPLNFLICATMAVGAVLVLLGPKATKEQTSGMATAMGKFDFAGAAAMTVFLACLIIALSMTSFFPLGGLISNVLFALAAICLIIFVLDIKRKKATAFVPSTVFSDRNSLVFSICNFLANFSVMSIIAFLPAYIRAGMSADPIVSTIGVSLASLLPTTLMAILGLILGAIFGRMIAKAGNARLVLTIGTVVRLIVYIGLLMIVGGVFGTASYLGICVLLFVLGVAVIQNSVTYSAGPQIQIRPELRMQSNSIIQLGQNLGAGVAVPVYTLIIALSTGSLIAGGMDTQVASALGLVNALPIMLVIGLVAVVILLFVGLLLKPLPKQEAPQDASKEG